MLRGLRSDIHTADTENRVAYVERITSFQLLASRMSKRTAGIRVVIERGRGGTAPPFALLKSTMFSHKFAVKEKKKYVRQQLCRRG